MNRFFYVWVLWGLGLQPLLAQRATPTPAAPKPIPAKVAAPALQTPFQGAIGYTLTYKHAQPELSSYLPDSMTLWCQYPLIRVVYHGGLSDSLRTELQWDAAQHVYYLIDRISSVAWTLDDEFQVPFKAPLKTMANDTVASLACRVYEIPVNGGKDRYSITDSIHFPYQMTDSLRDSLSHRAPPFLMPGQSCIPLRSVRTTAQGIVEAKAITIHPHVPDHSVFRMPSGYDLKPFDPRPRFHPLIPKLTDAPK
jgi:hypothetical protein